jgi:hypothetical protein
MRGRKAKNSSKIVEKDSVETTSNSSTPGSIPKKRGRKIKNTLYGISNSQQIDLFSSDSEGEQVNTIIQLQEYKPDKKKKAPIANPGLNNKKTEKVKDKLGDRDNSILDKKCVPDFHKFELSQESKDAPIPQKDSQKKLNKLNKLRIEMETGYFPQDNKSLSRAALAVACENTEKQEKIKKFQEKEITYNPKIDYEKSPKKSSFASIQECDILKDIDKINEQKSEINSQIINKIVYNIPFEIQEEIYDRLKNRVNKNYFEYKTDYNNYIEEQAKIQKQDENTQSNFSGNKSTNSNADEDNLKELETFLDTSDFKKYLETSPEFNPMKNIKNLFQLYSVKIQEIKADMSKFLVDPGVNSYSLGNTRCFWDTYLFLGIPFPLPLKYIDHKDKFIIDNKLFCSPNCCLAYCKENNIQGSIYLIKLLIKKMVDYETEIDTRKIDIKPALNKIVLEDYGGSMTISQYRKNFFDNKVFNLYEYPLIPRISHLSEDKVVQGSGSGARSKKKSKSKKKKGTQNSFTVQEHIYDLERSKPLPYKSKVKTLF